MSEPTVDPAVEALAEALCEWWDEDVESHHAANLPCTGCLEIAKGVARRLPAHGVTLAANRERACCTCVIGVCSEEGECCESHDCPGTLAADREPGLRAAIEAIKTHNGTPVKSKHLRWAATHESLCRSWISDVLTGLADALDDRPGGLR